MNLSPNAHQLLQRLRRAYVEAGEDGWCRETYWLDEEGTRCCVVGRAARLEGICEWRRANEFHAESPLLDELERAAYRLVGHGLVHANDGLGFAATCGLLDRMLAECEPVDAGVERALEEAAA